MQFEWEHGNLGDFIRLASGNTPSKGRSEFWGGEVPWISAKDMKRFWIEDSEDHLTELGAANAARIVPPTTTLILVRGMTLHNDVPICRVRRPSAFNQDVKAVLPKNGLDQNFLPYLLTANKSKLLNAVDSAGHGTGRLNTESILGLPVSVPPLPIQKKLSDFASSIDDKIELNRRMNAILEAMARALFKAWFVDFEPVHANLENRPSTSASPEIAKLFPSDFEDGIPKGWQMVKLVDVCERITKGTTPKNFAEHGINFIKAESLTTGRGFIREKLAFIDDATNNSLSRSQLRKDDVLFSIAGTIGRIARVIPDILPANTNQALAIVRANKDRIDPLFIEMLLSREEILHSLAGKTVQAVQANLSLTVLGATEFALPPQELLHKAFPVINSFDLKIKENSRENEVLKQLRDSLLPRLISGRIQVGE